MKAKDITDKIYDSSFKFVNSNWWYLAGVSSRVSDCAITYFNVAKNGIGAEGSDFYRNLMEEYGALEGIAVHEVEVTLPIFVGIFGLNLLKKHTGNIKLGNTMIMPWLVTWSYYPMLKTVCNSLQQFLD